MLEEWAQQPEHNSRHFSPRTPGCSVVFHLGLRIGVPWGGLAHVAIGATEMLTAALTKPERTSKRSTIAGAVRRLVGG